MILLNAIVPIFLIILIGWFFCYFKLISIEVAKYLMQFVFWVAAPAVIFFSISNLDQSEFYAWRFWLAYLTSLVILTSFSYLLFNKYFRLNVKTAIIAAFTTSIKNTIMIGFPILMTFAGSKAAIPMAISIIVFNCVVTPILVYLCELHKQEKRQSILHTFKQMIKNPLVLAALIGIIFVFLKIPKPYILMNCIGYFAAAFIPCALFSVGLELYNFKFEGKLKIVLTVCFLNLIFNPILAIILAFIYKLTAFYAVAFVIFSALPTAKSMYIYAAKYQIFEKEIATIISMTTVISLISLPIFTYISFLIWPLSHHLKLIFPN